MKLPIFLAAGIIVAVAAWSLVRPNSVEKSLAIGSNQKKDVLPESAAPPSASSKNVMIQHSRAIVSDEIETPIALATQNLPETPKQAVLKKKSPTLSTSTTANDGPLSLAEPSAFAGGVSATAKKSKTAKSLSSQNTLPASAPVAIELSPGVVAPLALVAPQSELTPVQASIQEELASALVKEIETAATQPGRELNETALSEKYYQAVSQSDEQYRTLFGQDAANQAKIKAVLEAQ